MNFCFFDHTRHSAFIVWLVVLGLLIQVRVKAAFKDDLAFFLIDLPMMKVFFETGLDSGE